MLSLLAVTGAGHPLAITTRCCNVRRTLFRSLEGSAVRGSRFRGPGPRRRIRSACATNDERSRESWRGTMTDYGKRRRVRRGWVMYMLHAFFKRQD